jgi:hypothetical protein
MVTAQYQASSIPRKDVLVERWFFTGIAIAMLATAIAGFIPSILRPAGRNATLSERAPEIQRSSRVLENDSATASRSADEVPSWTPNVSVSYLRRRGHRPRRGS